MERDPSDPSSPAGEGALTVSAAGRERAVEVLCAQFAADNIGLEELERRLDLAYAASTPAQLEALTADLPALADQPQARTPTAAQPVAGVAVQQGAHVADHDLAVAIMGGVERAGAWTPPRKMTVLAIMGGAELDYREATFGAEVIDVYVVAFMGGAELIVPPGVCLDVHGVAIMGGFEGGAPPGPVAAGAPTLRVRGLSLMGGVEVKVRLPGETEREARKRLKAEKQARRLRAKQERRQLGGN